VSLAVVDLFEIVHIQNQQAAADLRPAGQQIVGGGLLEGLLVEDLRQEILCAQLLVAKACLMIAPPQAGNHQSQRQGKGDAHDGVEDIILADKVVLEGQNQQNIDRLEDGNHRIAEAQRKMNMDGSTTHSSGIKVPGALGVVITSMRMMRMNSTILKHQAQQGNAPGGG
jgi:hypothetical protein